MGSPRSAGFVLSIFFVGGELKGLTVKHGLEPLPCALEKLQTGAEAESIERLREVAAQPQDSPN